MKKGFQNHYVNAVKSSSDMIEGKHYYSNAYKGELTYKGWRKYYFDEDIANLDQHDGYWMIFVDNAGRQVIMSPNDHNMDGSHYNPWMIFENETNCLICDFSIWFSNDDFCYNNPYDYFDENDYEDYEDYKDEL